MSDRPDPRPDGRAPRTLRDKLWWFDVIYPIALAALLFGSLTYIVYAGQRQSQLALMAESKLMEFSLRLSRNRPVRNPHEVLVVSADTLDIARLGRAPLGLVPEATADVYGRVITKLVNDGVPLIFVRWEGEAHPASEHYYDGLVRALRLARQRAKIYFVAPPETARSAAPALQEAVSWIDDDACMSPDVVQTECSFLTNYKDWVFQTIFEELDGPEIRSGQPLPWVSTELSSAYPRYILNLSNPAQLDRTSFQDLLAGAHDFRQIRAAFVGSDQGQTLAGKQDGSLGHRVLTVYDPSGASITSSGTPFHVYWAMVAQMALDHAMITVPPRLVIMGMTLAFCLLVIIVTGLFGGPAALGLYLVYGAMGPVVNAAAIRHLHLYVPLFDSYYFGMSTFIVAGLSRLSITAFQKWRLDAQRRLHSHVADLKGNFISLLSHNLNTPVAKMQGTLALLANQPLAGTWSTQVRTAASYVAQLEYAIRCVLIASALEEGAVNETHRNTSALVDEFTSAVVPSLRRLGVAAVVAETTADETCDLYVPLLFDVRAIMAAIGAMAALFHAPGHLVPLDVSFRTSSLGDDLALDVCLSSQDGWIPADAVTVLTDATTNNNIRRLGGRSFLPELLAGLARSVTAQYHGRIDLMREAGESGGLILIRLLPARSVPSKSLA